MKVILFYISSHGFGHITRVLARIESFIDTYPGKIYLSCGKSQISFAQKYLAKYSDKIIYNSITTDIGLINKKYSLEVDINNTQSSLIKFIDSWNLLINKELETIAYFDVDCIITDISPIGMLIGKLLDKKVIAISNFTWYNQYKHLNLSSKILNAYLNAESFIDEFWSYPLSLDLSHIKCSVKKVDFICRKFDVQKIDYLKRKYGKSIYISVGKSATIGTIPIHDFSGTVFITTGVTVIGNNLNVIELPEDTLDTHNYLAASIKAIIKAGWSTVSEAICANVPMTLLERPNILEDTHIIKSCKDLYNASSFKL